MMKFPQDEILNTVRRQQRAMHKQKVANDTLKREIDEYETQINAFQRKIEAHKASEELQRLRAAAKNLANKLAILTADFSAEENKRKKLEEEVSRENSLAGGLFKQSRENEELQTRVRTMENRLDKAMVCYNGNLATLIELRHQIDELRKDRSNFRMTMETMAKRRQEKEAEIAGLISESNDAYGVRDSRKMELAKLREAEQQDIKSFEETMARLNQTIEGQKIAQGRTIDQKSTLHSNDSQSGPQLEQTEELVTLTEQYQALTQRTVELCGMGSVQELFTEAEKLGRENFSLYTYVVEHGANRTRLQEQIDALELQRETLVAQGEDTEAEQSARLLSLTAEIQTTATELAAVRAQKTERDAAFAAVYALIGEVFEMLGCKWDEAPDGKSTVTAVNAMFCLSAIESVIAPLIRRVFDRAKLECTIGDIRPSSFLPEDHVEQAGGATKPAITGARSPEKEISAKLGEYTKPLSVEELRALLD
jgi:chromosome segregation ATPase